MNELEDILNYLETTSLEPHNDYTSEFSYKEQKVLFKYIQKLQKENQELKNQQKEFIEWLENESKELIRDAGYHQRICLEILDKYKEIIGGDNNE